MTTSIRGNTVKREGTAKIRSSKGTPVYECSYSYIVESTIKNEDYLTVLNTPGLPVVGVTVEPSGFAVCTGKSGTRRAQNPKLWDITCDFSSEVDDSSGSEGDPGNESNNPETWVPIYETKFWQYQEVATKDYAGDAIVNSAGQAFPSGITITRFLPMWEFFQIESASVTDDQVLARCDVVNSGFFKNKAAKTLLCTVLSSVIGRYYGSLRRLTQYQIKYKPDKWTLKRASIGTSYLDGSGDLVDYTNKSGAVINGNLDEDGHKTGNDGKDPPEILEFDVHQAVAFSFLRI